MIEGRQEYNFNVVVTEPVDRVTNSDYTFKVVTFIDNEAPQFAEPLEDIIIAINDYVDSDELVSYELPQIFDPEANQISMIKASLGSSAKWLAYYHEASTLILSPVLLDESSIG